MQDWVLFVPGFAASHLWRFANGGDRGERIWLSQVDVALYGLRELDTVDAISPPDGLTVRANSPILEVYQPFLSYLASKGVPILHFAYDWRADVTTNGQRMANLIQEWAGSQARFTIVAHSMGGLVAASALQRLGDQALSRVRNFIACGTPWRGSYRTVELFDGHHDTIRQVVSLNRIASRRTEEYWNSEALRVVASWPGAYDLLPMPSLKASYPVPDAQDFGPGQYFDRVNPWFSNAKYLEAIVRSPIGTALPPEPNVYNFRSVQHPTSGPMPTLRDGFPAFHFNALFGDGVVPEKSSQSPPAFNAIQRDFGAEHEQFLSDGDVQAAIGRIIGVEG